MSIGHLVSRGLFDPHTVLVGSCERFPHGSIFVVNNPNTNPCTVLAGSLGHQLFVGVVYDPKTDLMPNPLHVRQNSARHK